MMINNKFLNKYTYVLSEQVTLIISDGKSAVCMANNDK